MSFKYTTRSGLVGVLVLLSPWARSDEPIDILRENIALGISVLESTSHTDSSSRISQRDRLCKITMEIFDPVLFVRLALASDWKKFTIEEQAEFSNVFSTFLCRYYLPRLQERYGGERVNFTRQKFRSENRVSIEAEVLWEGLKVPIEVRMVLTGGQWKAYDLVVSGISAVMIYRAQFRAVLRKGSPADLIDEIRGKIDSTRDGPYMPS